MVRLFTSLTEGFRPATYVARKQYRGKKKYLCKLGKAA